MTLIEIVNGARDTMKIITEEDAVMAAQNRDVLEVNDDAAEVEVEGRMIQYQIDGADACNLIDGGPETRNPARKPSCPEAFEICLANQAGARTCVTQESTRDSQTLRARGVTRKYVLQMDWRLYAWTTADCEIGYLRQIQTCD